MHDAFLAAVIADPDSDAPRLVYADWLDEQPDDASRDRAAFIRGQCALAAVPPDDPAGRDLAATTARLLKRHRKRWAAPLAAVLAADASSRGWLTWPAATPAVEYERGFAVSLGTRADAYLRHHDALHRLAPLRAVTFTDANLAPGHAAAVAAVAACPAFTSLQRVAVNATLQPWQDIVAAGPLGQAVATFGAVERLGVMVPRLGPTRIKFTCRRPVGPLLVTAAVHSLRSEREVAFAAAVLDAMPAAAITAFAWDAYRPLDGEFAALVDRMAGSLTHLDLRATRFRWPFGFQPLAESAALPRLDRLDLREVELSGHDLGHLARHVGPTTRVAVTLFRSTLPSAFNALAARLGPRLEWEAYVYA